jgi:hypothetical protein
MLLLQDGIFSSEPRQLLLFRPQRLPCVAVALCLLLLHLPPVEEMISYP